MNNSSLISIIIPTYNRAHLIGKTLDSILMQTYENWECIIVDDGSSDNTKEIVSKYEKDSRFKYFERPKNSIKGPNSCRNFGFQMSKGSWINWLDSDDFYKKNALEVFFNSKDQNTDVVVANLVKVDVLSNQIIGYNRTNTSNLFQNYYTGFTSFYVCGPLWKREFLEEAKELFDENIRFLDDWDFNLRMLYRKPEIKFVDQILIQYNIDLDSLSNQIYKLNVTEIQSEIVAREKQLKIIKENQLIDYTTCLLFTRERYKIIFRDLLIKNGHGEMKRKLFFKLLQKDFELKNFVLPVKTAFGYLSFSLFNKGYFFFK
ncbi:glycosyltransferase [Flavobacterium sp. DG2-3]|uniref:glycosyltransferase family 2 protein n=1 Tax=Flavobacterium sp. DG2-3 TaxID=3068317 RepID=UPI00273EA278|nr:glycosyltransferase [Flavobacterium sp. DG2-3]MDP5200686.1 glycosyltransferase [Flavobacterium sp. DG2-3]